MRNVLLHIGYPKTATTWLQSNLFYKESCYPNSIGKHDEVDQFIVRPNSLLNFCGFDVSNFSEFSFNTKRGGSSSEYILPVLRGLNFFRGGAINPSNQSSRSWLAAKAYKYSEALGTRLPRRKDQKLKKVCSELTIDYFKESNYKLEKLMGLNLAQYKYPLPQ